ncbi:non-ribosomal peptide synthetase [Marinomonas mediterranea]|uniref:Amino acid adenylation domain protein n=1 Tax=Marinomonas mediterranea (strain ATCC 700492 / JCM 21426 / NBRC 103028 / MMB-1) TaxID=717774 RepID=F2JWF6_MARM1|nr:non-ribosomal peptide synthetase [Marinomonas mediterranea]ADZ90629.1 amino acid adenylation domain protein [Marinomonas mediterranea MMB-1]WCN08671.1 non-ribosomal peptide synthetase [Marinomonas mediterranea]WCN16799.1 non-ribosomal peptide synthetase [Marinomonas mediterranea MMB-1]
MALQDNAMNQEKSLISPLTDVQLGIWLGDQVAEQGNAFTIAHSVDVKGAINVRQLAESINETLLKADTVCTLYYENDDGQPVQQLCVELARVKTHVVNLVGCQDAERIARSAIQEDVNAELSLNSDKPLCRQVLYVVSETKVIWYQRFHHIMLDGFSFNVFTKQVSNHYVWAMQSKEGRLSEGHSSETPFTPFYDVVMEELAYKASKKYQDDRAFWTEYASNIDKIASLSSGKKTFESAQSERQSSLLRANSLISKTILDTLITASNVKRVNPADLSIALVFAYLHKMTGARNIPVGFPFMGRIGSASLLALGPVVNVLPLQIELGFEDSLDDLIVNIKAELKKVRKHQKYNAEQIARDVGRVGESFPLFAATINLRLFDYDLSFGDATAQIEHLAAGPVEDLDFGMHFKDGDLYIEWVANRQRYLETELLQHAQRFIEFVKQLAKAPERSIALHRVASAQERQQLQSWQKSPYTDNYTSPSAFFKGDIETDIAELFFSRPNCYAQTLALKTDRGDLSHKQLTQKVSQWTRAFKHLGLKQGDAVAIVLPRDERIVLATLALMQLRATFIPIDPEYPASRLEWIFEDSAPKALITTSLLASRLPASRTNTKQSQFIDEMLFDEVLLDDPDLESLIESQSSEPWGTRKGEADLTTSPLDLAYIMYTSGSTGKPKGVAIPYQGITNLFHAHRVADYEPLLAECNGSVQAAHTASFSFDSSWDMLLLLWMGQALHVVNDEMRKDAIEFVQYVRQEKINTIDVPPSFLMQMLDADLVEEGHHYPTRSFIGGEAASPALWERVKSTPNFDVRNYYGPTENSVDSVGCSVSDSEKVIIGKPIAGTQSYILDDGLNPVPAGVVGELYVSGPGLAHGYINRSGQTASRFIANPFEANSRMYRTGDLARWTSQGQIEYLGRSDHQVQVRGYRVELEEIENVIASVAGITAAKVYAVEQGASNRLIAYCVCPSLSVSPTAPLTASQIESDEARITARVLSDISKALPDYMVPSVLKVMQAFPLNVNGKIDRTALPPIDAPQRQSGKTPITLPEQLLCSAIANCLGLENVFADDDFFHLGGDSITAMSLGNILRKEGFRVRPKDVFAGKTPEAIAKTLSRLDEDRSTHEVLPKVSSHGELKNLPILQWFNEQTTLGLEQSYVQGVFVQTPSDVTPNQIHQALTLLAQRHPVLVAYVDGDTLHIPETIEGQDWLIKFDDKANAKLKSRNSRIEQQADGAFSQVVHAIAPQRGQLLKAAYLASFEETEEAPNNEEKRSAGLVIGIHHLAVDGVSWRILLQELNAITEDLKIDKKGSNKRSGPSNDSIRDDTSAIEETSLRQWQATLLDNIDVYRQQSAFWKEQLATRPNKTVRPDALRSDLKHDRVLLGVESTKTLLEQLPQDYKANVDEILMTVIALAYARHFEQSDVRFGLESHGRAELDDRHGASSDLSRTLGWLTSEFPIRFDLSGRLFDLLKNLDLPYEETVRRVRTQLQKAGECGIGYGVLRYLDSQNKSELQTLEQNNRPDVLFNYLGRFREGQAFWTPQQTQGVFKDAFAVHQSEDMPQYYPIELNIFVQEGSEGAQLALQWSWLPQHCLDEDINALTETIAAYAQCMHQYAKRHPANAMNTATRDEMTSLDIPEGSLTLLNGKYGALDKVLPVLPLQEGLLFHAQMNETTDVSEQHERDSSYSSLAKLTLEGNLNVSRLQRALDAVIDKHPQLAAIFDVSVLSDPIQILTANTSKQLTATASKQGSTGQRKKDIGKWPLKVIDLSSASEHEQAERIQEIERKELCRDFNVLHSAGQPLLHAVLVKCASNKHELFLNAHHLVVDGWSTPIMLNDLMVAYGDERQALTPTSVPYHQVVSSMVARDKQEMQAAWKAALDGVTPTLVFGEQPPADQVRTYSLCLDEAMFQSLIQAYQRRGLTLNSVLQTIWANVLSAMTGKFDLVFGTPISGRFNSVEGVVEHIGLFSNTVPVRVTLSPDVTLWEQAQNVQNDQVQLLEHDGLGLAEIQRLIQPTNQASGNVFDTLLVVENFPDQDGLSGQSFHGVQLTEVKNRGYTHYPLTILALPSNELELLFEYRGDEQSIQTIMARFELLLNRMIDSSVVNAVSDFQASSKIQPDVQSQVKCESQSLSNWLRDDTIARLNLQTEHEKSLIAQINDTTYALEPSTLRHQMQHQAARTPDEICLVDSDISLTYCQAREQVIALAHQLQLIGVQPGDIVAVALPRSVRLTIALWATIEVGAAYLPLDTGYPDDRLNYMLSDASPKALITLPDEASRFNSQATVVLYERLIDIDSSLKLLIKNQWNAPRLLPTDAAYLLYTSGSTGRPKGVLVSHYAIVNRILWMQDAYPMDERDTVLQKTPCSFDVSVWEFFWSAMVGAKLMMAPPEAHRDPQWLRQLVDKHHITTLHFVPSMLAAFVSDSMTATPTAQHETQVNGRSVCPSLRQVFCSGEALSKELSVAFESVFNTPLHNLYGPTEAAVDVTYHPAFGADLEQVSGVSVPIGKPVWNTQLRILDNYLRPVPVGVPGELYLCGVQLATGYWNRFDLTATRFVADPFGNGERMYRTGDVVRWLEDGAVEYLGRSDDQLKIRGQRIELGEIERVLSAVDGVDQCAVVAKTWGQSAGMVGGDTRQLIGYVVSDVGLSLDTVDISKHLVETLPSHMVPAVIIPLDALPLSANGKLDRKALPVPSETNVTVGREPRPGIETKMATTFAQVLETDHVYADDDFFALGGHSLLAVRLVSELRKQWQLTVSVGQVMVSPTIEKLAKVLSDEKLANNRDLAGFGLVLPIRQGKSTPIFCVHPASGFAWQYTGLSRYLEGESPLIGLQSPRPDGPIAAQANLDGMIEQHLQQLRSQQAAGPYRLMGYSLGGVIAHGLAVRLQSMGEEVSFLGLLDTYPPDDQDWSGPTDEEAQQEVEREKAQFMNDAETQEKDVMFDDIVANYADSIRHLSQATTPRFNGKAVLFVADRTVPEGMDIDATWAPFVDTLEKHHFDYPHEDIMSPDALAELGPLMNQIVNALDA